MSRIWRVSPLLASFAVCYSFASTASAAYIATEIATLTDPIPQSISINNLGQVAFTNNVADLSLPTHAFLYSGGKTIDLGGLGQSPISSSAGGLNDAGQVVGESALLNGNSQAFLYSNGHMIALGQLGTARADFSSATGINAAGQITGFTTFGVGSTTNWTEHAFLYANGVMKDLGVLAGKVGGKAASFSFATAINATGQVVGYSGWSGSFPAPNHAFLYSGGVMKDLGVLGQFVTNGLTFSGSRANAINNAGQVVGGSTTSDSRSHAFLYSGGVMKDLGVLGVFGIFKDSYSNATAINSRGQIVGNSSTSYGYTAFLYQNGQMRDLNTLLAPGSPWQLTEADGINDRGQIVAQGLDEKGRDHLLLLTPQVNAAPEPSGLTLGLLGLIAATTYRFRRPRPVLSLVSDIVRNQ